MDSIQAEMEQAARQACAKDAGKYVMCIGYEATMIASSACKKHGGDVEERTVMALDMIKRAQRDIDPKRQAEIDAAIEHAAGYKDTGPLDKAAAYIALSLAGKYGGDPSDYTERMYSRLKKERQGAKAQQ